VYRVGLGIDSHRLVENRPLILGGLSIPFSRGLDGHSDADCVLHALTDALLGAVGLGDIGELFPDTDPQWKGADSKRFLLEAVARLNALGWVPVNVDLTIQAERPKLSPYKPALRKSVADLLGLAEAEVNIKAKTGESVGHIGRGEAIACQAAVLIRKS
jgi:2-C-methyl-D-erythritol 2,4-cyclodiphosphate synthase